MQALQGNVGGGDGGPRRVDLGREGLDGGLGCSQVGRIRAAKGSVGGFGAGERCPVGDHGALGCLQHVLAGSLLHRLEFGSRPVEGGLRLANCFGPAALQHQVELRLLRLEGGLGELNVLRAAAALHANELDLLLDERCLGGSHVIRAGAGLNRRQFRLGRGQAGACLRGRDARALLVHNGQHVAGANATPDVDENSVEAADGAWQDADLLACADLTAVRQLSLNRTAAHRFGGDRRGRNGGGVAVWRPLATSSRRAPAHP